MPRREWRFRLTDPSDYKVDNFEDDQNHALYCIAERLERIAELMECDRPELSLAEQFLRAPGAPLGRL